MKANRLVVAAAQMKFRVTIDDNVTWINQTIRAAAEAGADAVLFPENEVYYVFANSVGRQGDDLWSAGDSKIVAPDAHVLALANNRDATVIQAELDLSRANRKYAREALAQPAFLRAHWKSMLAACKRQLQRQ